MFDTYGVMDIIKIALPALIALLGVIVTAVIAYRRWRSEQDAASTSDYRTDAQKAYTELWNRLEDIHVKLRTEGPDSQTVRTLLQGINAYLLKYSLWLDKEDMKLAQSYVQALHHFDELVRKSGDDDEKAAWETTASLPRKVIIQARAIQEATENVDSLRDTLIERFKKVLKGKFEPAEKTD